MREPKQVSTGTVEPCASRTEASEASEAGRG